MAIERPTDSPSPAVRRMSPTANRPVLAGGRPAQYLTLVGTLAGSVERERQVNLPEYLLGVGRGGPAERARRVAAQLPRINR